MEMMLLGEQRWAIIVCSGSPVLPPVFLKNVVLNSDMMVSKKYDNYFLL